jgi:hypothetical protein
MDSTTTDLDDDEDNPGLHGKMIDGVGNGMHLIIASFIKTDDKIRDQLLKNLPISLSSCVQISMASRFTPSPPTNQSPF